MKINDIFEAQSAIGVAVGTHNGKFYDIHFVDYNTQDALTGYLGNLGNYFVDVVREYGAWDKVFPFFEKHFRSRPLGEEYHSEDADFFLFGPLSVNELEGLADLFVEETFGESL